jgi:hypothetical protein
VKGIPTERLGAARRLVLLGSLGVLLGLGGGLGGGLLAGRGGGGLALLGLGDEHGVDVGQNTALGDGHT